MRGFRDLYYLVSNSLLGAQISFVSIWLYNKIAYDRVLYYGDKIKPSEISENFFNLLKILLYASFALMIIWAVLTPFAVISNRRSVEKKDHIDIVTGLWGFISAVILLIVDPFGMFKWFTN